MKQANGFSTKKIFFDTNLLNNFKLAGQSIDFYGFEKKQCEMLEYVVCESILNGLNNVSFEENNALNLKNELLLCYLEDRSVLSLLSKILSFLKTNNLRINNIAVHLTAQKPRLCLSDINYKFLMRDYLSDLFCLKKDDVVVQAGTGEKIGDTGHSNAILIFSNVKIVDNTDFNLNKKRIGFGYDRHRFEKGEFNENKMLTICSQKIKYNKSISAHSDGDLILHAIVNAIFSTINLGDIGEHFPDTDPEWSGADSMKFANYAMEKLSSVGGKILNIDAELIISKKLYDFIEKEYSNFIDNSKNILVNLCILNKENIYFIIRIADKNNSNCDEECIENDDGVETKISLDVVI